MIVHYLSHNWQSVTIADYSPNTQVEWDRLKTPGQTTRIRYDFRNSYGTRVWVSAGPNRVRWPSRVNRPKSAMRFSSWALDRPFCLQGLLHVSTKLVHPSSSRADSISVVDPSTSEMSFLAHLQRPNDPLGAFFVSGI